MYLALMPMRVCGTSRLPKFGSRTGLPSGVAFLRSQNFPGVTYRSRCLIFRWPVQGHGHSALSLSSKP